MKGLIRKTCPSLIGLLCGLCLLANASDAHTKYLDRLKILDMLRTKQFTELEKTLAQQELRYQQGKIPEEHVEAAYLTFGNSDPEFEPRFREWVQQEGSTGRSHLARGIYYRNLGWITRGYRYASRTVPERFRGMRQYFALAKKDLEKAVHLNPHSATGYSLLINLAMAQGQREDIEQIFVEGLRFNPQSYAIRWKYLFSLLPWYSGLSKEECLNVIQQFLKNFVHDTHLHLSPLKSFPAFAQAEFLRRKNQRESAIPFYERSLNYGRYYWYSYDQGHNFYFMGKHSEAIQAFTQGLEARPQVPKVHKWLGKTYIQLDQPKKALSEFQKALQLDSHDPDTLTEYAYILVNDGKYQEAIGLLEKALLLGPYDEYVVDKLGRVYLYNLKRPEKGLEYLKRATEIKPKKKKYWYHYGVALYQLRNCQAVQALHHYQTRCNSGGKCSKKKRKWAIDAINDLTGQQGCGKTNPTMGTLREMFRALSPF